MRTYGFIGCGNMGGALAKAAMKTLPPENILLHDALPRRAQALCAPRAVSLAELAQKSDVLVIGVKPQAAEALFETLRPLLAERKSACAFITMMAAVSIARVRQMAGMDAPCIRIMPNMPAAVGEGMTLYCVEDEATAALEKEFLAVFAAAGLMSRVPENRLDAAGIVTGCGPAYACLFAEALADGAVACGVARADALLYAAQMLKGTAEVLLSGGRHPAEVKDAVCSPGGTTIAGVRTLEESAFRAAVMDAVIASYERTVEMTRG